MYDFIDIYIYTIPKSPPPPMETSMKHFTMDNYMYFSNSSNIYKCTHTYIRALRSVQL